jgi:S1-C subfamily serine protease
MKKIVKSLIACLCAVTALFGASACGKSAYDVAVKNGFQGTEKEWLASLQGIDGKNGADLTAKDIYETAVQNGYEGTYLDFCQNVLKVNLHENNDVDTIARNVTSVVSVYCGFSQTVRANPWTVQTRYYPSGGAGVIIDLDKETGNALIVTNYHVVFEADSDAVNGISDSIYLYTYGAYNAFTGSEYTTPYADTKGDGMKATYVGGAMEYDIAILSVQGSEHLKACLASEAKFAESDEVQVGEKVFAIGNPDGAGIAATEGIISVESEYIHMEAIDGSSNVMQFRVIRTDAAINSGNSGGALFNANGELIGITNAKNANSQVDNMGYALHSSQVRNLVENILDNRAEQGARVAFLGIMVQTVASKAYYDEHGRLKIMEEFEVASVNQGSANGKLKVGDKIKGIKINDGEWVNFTRQYQLIDQLLRVRKGNNVTLKLVDSNGVEREETILFDQDSYFVKYD